jgi:hypothetical protein
MTRPTEPPEGSEERPVDLSKRDPSAADPNDPYRFGLPDQLPPPEYAPPGWAPPGGWPAPGTPPPGVQHPAGFGPPPGYPPQPPQYPYQYGPPPPSYSPYHVPRPGRGKAVAALVLGVLSIVMFWSAFLDSLLVIAAVAFGVVALHEGPSGSGSPRGMAIAGLVCAAIGTLLATIWTVFLLHAISQCGGLNQSGQPGFRTCVQNHFG